MNRVRIMCAPDPVRFSGAVRGRLQVDHVVDARAPEGARGSRPEPPSGGNGFAALQPRVESRPEPL